MLDERQEYALYLTKGYGGLVRKDNIEDSLKGTRHILTVLARGFLDICRAEGIEDIDKQHRYTISFLKVWLIGEAVSELKDDISADMKEISEYPELKKQMDLAEKANLLSHCLERCISLKKKKAFDEATCKADLKKKVNSWGKSMFSSGKTSSFNAIYFKSILADAIHRGPLTNSVLLIRADDHKYFRLNGNFGKNTADRKARLAFIFAIVALYLQSRPDNCESTPVVIADMSNYIGKPCNKDAKKVSGSIVPFIEKTGFQYKWKPLFIKKHVKGSFTKLTVNSDWLSYYDIHLAPADKPIPKGYVLYDDKDLCGIYLQNDKK